VIDGTATDAERSFAALRDDGFLRDLRFAGPIADLVACDALVATSAGSAETVRRQTRCGAATVHVALDEEGGGLRILAVAGAQPLANLEEGGAAAARFEDLLRRLID
jgi:hypothetical protein